MRSALAHAAQLRAGGRQRAVSLSTVPPAETDSDYDPHLANVAASILYRSPLPSQDNRPVYILNAAAFPDATDLDYDSLLSYVLARLPGEDALLSGTEYEIIFFAGGTPEGATAEKKQGPGMGWYLQAYHVLSRATRKKLQKLYIVHPRTWVRVLVGVFGTIVSPKFRRKIVHVHTLSALALHVPLEKLLIPPSVYLHDRRLVGDIYVPFATGKRAFGVKKPLPVCLNGETRLPRVLRETTKFILSPRNVRMEGLFRIPPHSTLAGVLKEAYDRGQHYIVWKERGATVVQPGIEQSLLDEIRLEDAYGVHQAASLIKQWYRDLREPIFPESSYTTFKTRYSNPDTPITPEALVEILLPSSPVSPLSPASREILTRHLLPLLSEVAAHEKENKMNPENLAICFAICLVCGSNQMEDAKMSTTVRRILQAAVEIWPQLRDGMAISPDALYIDIESPADPREYEDPLEAGLPPPHRRTGDDVETDDSPSSATTPTNRFSSFSPLSPRSQENGSIPPPSAKKPPTLPPRPTAQQTQTLSTSPVRPGSQETSPAPPLKRKPAPPPPPTIEPPRYSSVFDADGRSLHVADSPASYASYAYPADGFGPPRRADFSFEMDGDEKKGVSLVEPEVAGGKDELGKGKRGFAEQEQEQEQSGGSELARMAAQKAATASLAREGVSSPPLAASSAAAPPADSSPLREEGGDTAVFRKPTWPASALRQQSLAKPVLPRHAQTLPSSLSPSTHTSTSASASASTNGGGTHLTASNVPRPRAPSPGLLKRMSSMELASHSTASPTATASSNTNPSTTTGAATAATVAAGAIPAPERRHTLEPQKLNLRSSSVEDLRRLYEERLSTAQGLMRAGK